MTAGGSQITQSRPLTGRLRQVRQSANHLAAGFACPCSSPAKRGKGLLRCVLSPEWCTWLEESSGDNEPLIGRGVWVSATSLTYDFLPELVGAVPKSNAFGDSLVRYSASWSIHALRKRLEEPFRRNLVAGTTTFTLLSCWVQPRYVMNTAFTVDDFRLRMPGKSSAGRKYVPVDMAREAECKGCQYQRDGLANLI
jgi:hypothetical protein